MAAKNYLTEMVAGVESGLETFLVLSGVTRTEDLGRFPYRPPQVYQSVADTEPI